MAFLGRPSAGDSPMAIGDRAMRDTSSPQPPSQRNPLPRQSTGPGMPAFGTMAAPSPYGSVSDEARRRYEERYAKKKQQEAEKAAQEARDQAQELQRTAGGRPPSAASGGPGPGPSGQGQGQGGYGGPPPQQLQQQQRVGPAPHQRPPNLQPGPARPYSPQQPQQHFSPQPQQSHPGFQQQQQRPPSQGGPGPRPNSYQPQQPQQQQYPQQQQGYAPQQQQQPPPQQRWSNQPPPQQQQQHQPGGPQWSQNAPPPPAQSWNQAQSQPMPGPQPEDQELRSLFSQFDSSRTGQLGSYDLQRLLAKDATMEAREDCVKMLMNIFDTDRSGSINFMEFEGLYRYIKDWHGIFLRFDRDNSGLIDRKELHAALLGFGFSLPPEMVKRLEKRFAPPPKHVQGDPHGHLPRGISFDRFLLACVTVKHYTEAFRRADETHQGRVTLDYNQFMDIVLDSPS